MDILVDIGNTRIKWAIINDSDEIAPNSLIHGQADFEKLLESEWALIGNAPDQMAVSCVSAKQVNQSVKHIAKKLWPSIAIYEAESSANGSGVSNGYKNPAQLGVDRWLGLLAARQMTRQAVCIADCGTALTIDLMNEQGMHLGGVICPGLTMMRKSLCAGTSALTYDEQDYPVGLSDATLPGIYSGTFLAVAGLIEQIVSRQARRPHILLTGGDASKLAAYLGYQSSLVPDLVLRGLRIFLKTTR
jgi:type III pantothenate kinase